MCGRYVIALEGSALADALERRFGLEPTLPEVSVNYNAAPSQTLPVIVAERNASRRLEPMRWNLIPRWRPKPGTTPPSLFNARSATVAQKPSFRKLVPQQRCLVPAAGFYEWQRTENGQKQPYYFSLREKPFLAFAGIWDEWRDPEHPEAPPQRSYAILTTGPNRLMEPIHDRMPVILKPEDEAEWLSPDVTDPVQLERLYQPYSTDAMQRWPVSQAVNSPRQNKAELILNSQ
jgi:putative SOS response-associated peptidase YedK